MTIKEYQKIYKKVNKAITLYNEGCNEIKLARGYDIPEHVASAKKLMKAARTLEKLASVMHVNLDEMRLATATEDSFVRWCIFNDVEMHESVEDEQEESDA